MTKRPKSFYTASLVLLAAISGCTLPKEDLTNNKPIQVALERDVKECSYRGDVHGSTSSDGLTEQQALTSAKNVAIQRAQKRKATHIVWTVTSVLRGKVAIADGYLYNCEK